MFHRIEDRVLGDRVEDDALDLLVFQDLLAAQDFQHVPGNRLALAVRIGRQDDLVGALYGAGDVGQALGGLGVDFPFHREIGVGIDRTVLGRQVADMAEGGENLIVSAEIFVDRLGLGRRFDDDDIHEIAVPSRRAAGRKPGAGGLPAGAGTWSRGSGLSNLGRGRPGQRELYRLSNSF